MAKTAALDKQELKVFDTALSFQFDTTGTVEVPSMNLVQTGDTLNNRDGATIKIKSLQVRGQVTFIPGAAATAAAVSYLYLVLDRQPNGAAPAVTDVFTSTALNAAMPNVPNQFRFKILRRFAYISNSQAGVTTAYNNVCHVIDEYIRFEKPIEVRFTASTGAITDVVTNNLLLIAGSNLQDDTVGFDGTARIRFTG